LPKANTTKGALQEVRKTKTHRLVGALKPPGVIGSDGEEGDKTWIKRRRRGKKEGWKTKRRGVWKRD
jgi:hypothetical protein